MSSPNLKPDLTIGPGVSKETSVGNNMTKDFDKQSSHALLKNHPSSGTTPIKPKRMSRYGYKTIPRPLTPRPSAPKRRSSQSARDKRLNRLYAETGDTDVYFKSEGGKRKRRRKTRRKSRKRKRKTRRKRKLRRKRKTRRKR